MPLTASVGPLTLATRATQVSRPPEATLRSALYVLSELGAMLAAPPSPGYICAPLDTVVCCSSTRPTIGYPPARTA